MPAPLRAYGRPGDSIWALVEDAALDHRVAELRQPGGVAGIEDGDVEQEGKNEGCDQSHGHLPPG